MSVAQPGLGFKTPWIEEVVRISTQTHVQPFPNLPAYSRDQQPAEITLSVNWHIPPDQVDTVYGTYGGADGVFNRLVVPKVLEETKTVFGQFAAVTAIQDRSRLNNEVTSAIQNAVKGPVVIDSVQIENIDFSEAYENSIEQRMLAEVEVQKLRQNAEREKVQAEIAVTQARGQADAVRENAKASAEAIRIKGEAEAAAIDARGKALRDNPQVVELVQAEKWNGQLPTTMVPNSTVPFLGMK